MSNKRSNEIFDEEGYSDEILSSGFSDFDYAITGFRKGDLYVLGGRPAMGKSLFAMNVAKTVVIKQKKPVLYISLEQPKDLVVARILKGARKETKNQALVVDDTPGLQVESLRELLEKDYCEFGIELIIIDYLQLMRTRERCKSKEEAILKILVDLKTIAKEFNLSILLLSQISSLLEDRDDHRPLLSDFNKNYNVELVADCIFLIYRDEHYDSNSEKKGVAEIIVVKNKYGPLGTIELRFVPQKGRFEDISSGGCE